MWRSALERSGRQTASRRKRNRNKNNQQMSPFSFQPTKHQNIRSSHAVSQRQKQKQRERHQTETAWFYVVSVQFFLKNRQNVLTFVGVEELSLFDVWGLERYFNEPSVVYSLFLLMWISDCVETQVRLSRRCDLILSLAFIFIFRNHLASFSNELLYRCYSL